MGLSEEEKRRRGLHYELGQLPAALSQSAFFWRLPHGLRRCLHAATSPLGFYRCQRSRARLPENTNTSTLKPFRETRSVFVHIPKAAGIAVSNSLYGRKTGDHRTISDYKICLTRHEFRSFFKFTFVRNPWDRLYSAYCFLGQGGRNRADQAWAERYLSPFSSFEEFVLGWVDESNIHLGLHFRPQHEFLRTKDLDIEVDYIGYFESLTTDYEFVSSKIASAKPLQTMNRTAAKEKDYRRQYTDATREIVGRVYASDIRILGYDFDGILAATPPRSLAK